jgi:predicted RNA-binding Zn ribbon-like protein
MGFAWEDHHFTTRVPCLDFANTVVWRSNPEKLTDRLRTRNAVGEWTEACSHFDGLKARAESRQSLASIHRIRAAIDGFFRTGADWPLLVRCYADALDTGTALERELLHDAMRLALGPDAPRVKVCGNCGWLFIDRTRNQNKRWCIAELCGNRTKARRHYARIRDERLKLKVQAPSNHER